MELPPELDFFRSLFDGLSLEDIMQLYALAETRELKAGEIYIKTGVLSYKLALIRQGLIRAFLKNQNGDEVTLMLRWEQQFVASMDGVLHQRPSRFIYQALEDTILVEVDFMQVQSLIDNHPKLSAARNHILLQMLSQAMDRVESFVLLSAEERYLKLMKEKPGIFNRVPDKYISTLLGITPVSLSRIRKRISLRPH